MTIILSLRSHTLKTNYHLISQFRLGRSACSLNDLEKNTLKRYATLLAENMETIHLGPIIISPYSGTQTVDAELLALLEAYNPAVKYVPALNTLGD